MTGSNNNLFGTDGIRAEVGTSPLSFTTMGKLGSAIGMWALSTYGSRPRIVVASDPRISTDIVKCTLFSGLLLHNIELFDAGTLPTPAIDIIIPHFDAHGGIIISASHNSHHYNGIKIIDAKTGKLSPHDEEKISELFNAAHTSPISYAHVGRIFAFPNAHIYYTSSMINKFSTSFLINKKIVIDCANGATSKLAPDVMEYFGARVIALHHSPTGTNINDQCGSTFPHVVQQAVLDNQADIGFAFDGDGDRLVVVNRHGIIKDGDDILALLLENPVYQHIPTVVGTIMSNQGFEIYVNKKNKNFIRTAVGDKHIAIALEKYQTSLGGEPSGHIIMRDHCRISDGIFCALRILQTMIITNNLDLETFEKFPHATINLPITQKKDLHSGTCFDIISQSQEKLKQGRLIVRYSGTEPILRIAAEAPTKQEAHDIANKLAQQLRKELA